LSVGSLIGTVLAGVLADHGHTLVAFWLVCGMCAQAVLPVLLGHLPLQVSTAPKMSGILPLAAVLSASAVVLGVVTAYTDPAAKMTFALVSVALLLAGGFVLLPRELAICNGYMCTCNVLQVSVRGALDFWYTADYACVPGGPAFSMTYYITVAGAVAAASTFVGVGLFRSTLSRWSFRDMFRFTALLRCFGAVADVVIINRWNLAVGVPDRVMFMAGNAVVGPIIAAMDAMPMVALTSKLCPEGEESTVYALLASYQNYGGAVASAVGVAAARSAGIHLQDDGAACTFDNLSPLVVVCNMFLPLLAYPLAGWLPEGGV
jgi:hypothetical protein